MDLLEYEYQYFRKKINVNFSLSDEGINYYVSEQKNEEKCTNYWKRFRYFHKSPVVKMSYHFVSEH